MNTTIIKGAMKVGLGKAVKNWGSLTGNRKLYVEGLAEEWIGRGQRSYGRLKDASQQASKMVVKKVKKNGIIRSLSDTNKMLLKRMEKMHVPAPALAATALTVGILMLRSRY